MIEISKREKIALQKLMDTDAIAIMERLANALANHWSSGSSIKETEFQTVAETIKREERRTALRIYLEELQRICNE